MKKIYLLLLPFLIGAFCLNAQTEENPWLVGVGLNAVDYTSTDPFAAGFFDGKDWNYTPTISKIWIDRRINNSFVVELTHSMNAVTNFPAGEQMVSRFNDTDLYLKYMFANGYILDEYAKIDPYLLIGGGVSYLDKTAFGDVDFGLGFNYWMDDKWGFNVQTVYNMLPTGPDYFHHSAGLVLRFGKGNKKIKDMDGDGIADKEDACPTVAGSITTKGCPDADKDGTADADDKCPNTPGPKSMNGCPEKAAFDKNQVEKDLNFNAKSINFESSKDVIKSESYATLDNIVGILNDYPSAKIAIHGHTDSSGDDAMNMTLSQQRAAAVMNYFISKGINANRLSSKGFGETSPIADNGTSEGRAMNRRVEIKLQD